MQASGAPITPGDIEQLKNSTKHDWIKGRVVAGKYQILSVIAAGGMGIVLKAQHLQLNAPVAVKFSFDSKSSSAAQRFLNEAQVLTKLRHPGVAQVLDAGSEAGALFLVMEFINGQSLLAAVKDSYKLTGEGPELEELFQWLQGIADALDYCHSQDVVHRDLKPANVIVRSRDNQPILVDFGLAMWEYENDPQKNSLTQTGQVLGTPHYMAPEQVENHSDFGDIGPGSDVWALGAILFYCLSGQTPYPEGPAIQFYRHLMLDDPRTLTDVKQSVSSDISEFCARCLTRQSDLRPSMAECRDFFEGYFQIAETGSRRGLYASIFLACLAPVVILSLYLGLSNSPPKKAIYDFGSSESPTKERTTIISGKVNKSISSVKVGKDRCTIENRSFEKKVQLTEGENTIHITVKNREDRSLDKTVTVVCDLSPPLISVDNKQWEGFTVLEAGDDLTGTIKDLTTVTFSINERKIDLSDLNQFRWRWPNTNTLQIIKLRAKDAVGHSTTLELTVITRDLIKSFHKIFQEASVLAAKNEKASKTKALTLLSDLIKRYRGSKLLPKVYRLRYRVYNDLKDNEQALESLDMGVELCKKLFQDKDDSDRIYSDLHSLRASCRLWKFRRYEEAAQDYNRGLELDPSKTGDNPNLAHCYRRMGQVDKALEILNLSVKNGYNIWSAYIYRAEIQDQQKRYKAALRDYESALKRKPEDPGGKCRPNIRKLKEKIAKGEGVD
ncbi:MAG: serine/threonine-protein kinase [Planctomycetota bacterium]|nr:serine/threonine-protein kinase [Planctomycetota bacterium]